jgi:hypothetical protein
MPKPINSYKFNVAKETNFHELIRLGIEVCKYPGKINWKTLAKFKRDIKNQVDYFEIPQDLYNDV